MPTDDYIKRSDAMKAFANRVMDSNNSDFARVPTWNDAVSIVEAFPDADVEPKRKTGVWLEEEATEDGNWRYTCSVCGYADIQSRSAQVPYCWHCGSRMQKMDKEADNERI